MGVEPLLTTREVAELLAVHPKHVYRLLRDGLPSRRVGTEWRFVRAEVLAWSEARSSHRPRQASSVPADIDAPRATFAARPPLLASNGDLVTELLLEVVRTATPFVLGSVQADRAEALELLARSAVLAAGCHGEGPPTHTAGERTARIHLVDREIGLASKDAVPSITADRLARERLALRPSSAGVRVPFDAALKRAGLSPAQVARDAMILGSHRDVAIAVASGAADVGLLSRAWATRLGLAFVPLAVEPYGVVLRAADLGDPRIVALSEVAQGEAFRAALGRVPGYDAARAGEIRYDRSGP